MKNLIIILTAILLIGCTSAEERLEKAVMFEGKLIYRQWPTFGNTNEVFVLTDGSKLKIINVYNNGKVESVMYLSLSKLIGCQDEK